MSLTPPPHPSSPSLLPIPFIPVLNSFPYKVTATDLDVGVYGVVTYSITGGNMGGVFAINQSTGQLSTLVLINRSVLVYTLNLMAVDGGVF